MVNGEEFKGGSANDTMRPAELGFLCSRCNSNSDLGSSNDSRSNSEGLGDFDKQSESPLKTTSCDAACYHLAESPGLSGLNSLEGLSNFATISADTPPQSENHSPTEYPSILNPSPTSSASGASPPNSADATDIVFDPCVVNHTEFRQAPIAGMGFYSTAFGVAQMLAGLLFVPNIEDDRSTSSTASQLVEIPLKSTLSAKGGSTWRNTVGKLSSLYGSDFIFDEGETINGIEGS